MSVSVLTTVKRRRDTTEAWEYVNPILADREQGFEIDSYGTPVGMKMGDGVTHWVDLPYWFSNASGVPPEEIFIPKGDPIPYNIDMTTRLQFGAFPTTLPLINKYNDDTTQDFDVLIPWETIQRQYNYLNSSYATLLSIDVFGNDDGSGNFKEDTYILLKV